MMGPCPSFLRAAHYWQSPFVVIPHNASASEDAATISGSRRLAVMRSVTAVVTSRVSQDPIRVGSSLRRSCGLGPVAYDEEAALGSTVVSVDDCTTPFAGGDQDGGQADSRQRADGHLGPRGGLDIPDRLQRPVHRDRRRSRLRRTAVTDFRGTTGCLCGGVAEILRPSPRCCVLSHRRAAAVLTDEVLEPLHVQLAGSDRQAVPRGFPAQKVPASRASGQLLAQSRHVNLQGVPGLGGRLVAHKASVSRAVGTTRFAPSSSTATRTRSRSPLNVTDCPSSPTVSSGPSNR